MFRVFVEQMEVRTLNSLTGVRINQPSLYFAGRFLQAFIALVGCQAPGCVLFAIVFSILLPTVGCG